MDDLEAVWGPDGTATTDAGAVRFVAPPPTDAAAPHARVSTLPTPTPTPTYESFPPARAASTAPFRSTAMTAAIGILGIAIVGVVAVAFLRSWGERAPVVAPPPAPPTTVVSAATDLLGLSKQSSGGAPADGDAPTMGAEPAPPSSTTTSAPGRATRPAAPSSMRTQLPLDGAERAAHAFLDTMRARDCDGLWSLLNTRTRTFLTEASSGGTSGRDDLCEGLRTEPIPPMTVQGPAQAFDERTALVRIESGGEVEDLAFVVEDGRWLLDLLGPDRNEPETFDGDGSMPEDAKRGLRNALTAESTIATDDERFTDDVRRLASVEPALRWRNGIAAPSALAGEVFVAIADGGRVVCLSSKADNGARFMIKRVLDGETSYAGGEIPSGCDGASLAPSW